MRRRLLQGAALAPWTGAASLLSPGAVQAQSAYPNRPLHWVVPFPAGGGSDFIARQLSPLMARALGQPIVVENRPGAAGIIGTEQAARAAPDGHTLLNGDNGAMIFHAAMYRKLPYDPRDFAPVGFMARFPLILAVHPGSGFDSARQLLQTIQREPGRHSYASPGIGSPHHLAMELLKDRTRSYVVHVPYRGTAFALQDVVAGQVPITVVDTAGGLAQIRAGRLRPLAVMQRRRIPQLPDLPTLDELGVDGFEATAWQALFVPRGTPTEVVQRLSTELQRALQSPELRPRLEEFGLEVAPSDARQLADFLDRETPFWHRLIRERRLSAE
jgi:tripartite-type tricarboxylate transporter receptor subunit TctC